MRERSSCCPTDTTPGNGKRRMAITGCPLFRSYRGEVAVQSSSAAAAADAASSSMLGG